MTPPEIAPANRSMAWEALGILALSLILNLAGNGQVSLWDRDEPRYAECTREMRASGDWVHPRFNDEPRYQKPVLIYWLMLAGTAIGGDNPFGARLASTIAGAASCVLLWGFGCRLFGRRIGRMAALILATAPIFVVNSKLATTDATLAFLFLSCQISLWSLSQRESKTVAAIFWTALALATLTKGPVAPAMIAIAGLVSWACGGPTKCWSRLNWRWGLILFTVIASPWYIAIGIMTRGEFFRVAVGSQVIHRVANGMEQHGGFPGYYPVTTVLSFYPWSTLLPAALVAGFVRRKTNPAIGFLLGWIFGPMILLECVKTKLVHYYLPAYPACALLVGMLIASVADSGRNLRRWPMGRLAVGSLVGVGLTLLVVSLGGVIVLPWTLKWPCLFLAAIVGAGTFFAAECFRSGRAERATFALVGTWAAVMLLVGAWLLPKIEPYRLPQRVAENLAEVAAREKARPVLAMYQEPSVIYALGSPTAVMKNRPWLRELLSRDGAVVTALSKAERAFLEKDRSFVLSVSSTLTGFNLSKGRSETLDMVVIRPASPVASRTSRERR